MGGRVVGNESYSEGDTDFSAQLTALKSRQPQGIFIPGYYTEAGLIAIQARKLNLQIPLFGADGWDSPKLAEIGGASIEGSYFSSHFVLDAPQEVMRTFVKNYHERYHEVPDGVAALAYDSMGLLVDAFRRAQSIDPKKVRDALAATQNFPGVTGTISIDENRNARKPAIIIQIKNGQAHYIDSIEPGN
jgi:branched-chain amino acid transport system substrate-binding protein